MKLYNIIALIGLGSCIELTGKIINVPGIQLKSHEKIVNGQNLPSRVSVTLTPAGGKPIRSLVNQLYEFTFPELAQGTYYLDINSHDFMINPDRFKIEVDDTSISATDYYLLADMISTTKNVTNSGIVTGVVGVKEYYERRNKSLKDMAMESPLGYIFRSPILTALFCFVVVMSVGPYILKIFNPELAKRMNEIQQNIPEKKEEEENVEKVIQPKIEEISRSDKEKTSVRRRK